MKKLMPFFTYLTFVVLYYLLRFTWFEVYDDYGNYVFKDFIGPGHFIIYFIVCMAMVFSAIFLGLSIFTFLSSITSSEKHPIISAIVDILLFLVIFCILGFSAVKLKWALYMPICLAFAGPTFFFGFRFFQAILTLILKIIKYFISCIFDK